MIIVYWILLILLGQSTIAAACGKYIFAANESYSGAISSPNYPNYYSNMDKCIWFFETNTNYSFEFTLVSMQGEGDNDTCQDYIEITRGLRVDFVLNKTCDQENPLTVSSSGKYARIKFLANYINVNTGFKLTWKVAKLVNIKDTVLPETCQDPGSYACPNKECVIRPMLCNNVSDCGCDASACDEGADLCVDPYPITTTENWMINSGIAFSLFVVLFIAYGLVDSKEKEKPCTHIIQQCLESGICKPTNKQTDEDGIDARNKALQEMIRKLENGEDIFAPSEYSTSGDNTSRRVSSTYLSGIGGSSERERKISDMSERIMMIDQASRERFRSTSQTSNEDLGGFGSRRSSGASQSPVWSRRVSFMGAGAGAGGFAMTVTKPDDSVGQPRKISSMEPKAYGSTLSPMDLPPEMRRGGPYNPKS